MMPAITAAYAALLAILLLALSARIIAHRRSRRISLGSGGDAGFERLIRGHANLSEYAPIAILLLAFLEMDGTGGWVLHGLGASFVAGRVAHAAAFLSTGNLALRTFGMVATLTVIGVAAILILARAAT